MVPLIDRGWWHQSSLTTLGAFTNIRNKEKQIPYDLSAKNPEVGRLLMVRGEYARRAVSGWVELV